MRILRLGVLSVRTDAQESVWFPFDPWTHVPDYQAPTHRGLL